MNSNLMKNVMHVHVCASNAPRIFKCVSAEFQKDSKDSELLLFDQVHSGIDFS